MSGDGNQGNAPSAVRGIAGLVVANTSLLVAVLVYMGWAYDDALYGYFHVSPLDLDVGIVEYMLRSLRLFSPGLVPIAAVIATVAAVRTWGLEGTPLAQGITAKMTARAWGVPGLRRLVPARGAGRPRPGRVLLIGAGIVTTALALGLAWAASRYFINTYLILVLFGAGSLLLTWPTRAESHGRFPYSLAVVITAVCALWAASLYARDTGIQAARNFVRDLPTRTSVVVYSTQRLALSGPGVTVQALPPGFSYRFEYQGFRMLLHRAGTYYLLPVGWNPGVDITYVIDDSDLIRVDLLSGARRSG